MNGLDKAIEGVAILLRREHDPAAVLAAVRKGLTSTVEEFGEEGTAILLDGLAEAIMRLAEHENG